MALVLSTIKLRFKSHKSDKLTRNEIRAIDSTSVKINLIRSALSCCKCEMYERESLFLEQIFLLNDTTDLIPFVSNYTG